MCGPPFAPDSHVRARGPRRLQGRERRLGPHACIVLVWSALTLASCRGCDEAGAGAARDAAPAATSVAVSEVSTEGGALLDAGSAADANEPYVAGEPYGDAGASSCRLLYGPAEQPFRGPAAMSVTGGELRMIVNDAGKPRTYTVPLSPVRAKALPVVPPRPASFVGVRWPPCALAGRFVYCQGPGGAVHRSALDPERSAKDGNAVSRIAEGLSGTRIAAAPLGKDHAVVAFLERRWTTEGNMLQAFVALDEREPVRLSEDGAGATTLRLVVRGESVVAVYLDTRTAMVPVHARTLSLRDGELELGVDTVVFVGGVPERGIDFDAVSTGETLFALVPMPRDALDFGMAALPIHDPPKIDVPAVWSPYPNGLDPAPIGAAPAGDGKSAWVARVRPREGAPGSPRILELGRLSDRGVFSSYGEIASGKPITDVALVEDGAGAVWISYGDSKATWLERRLCP